MQGTWFYQVGYVLYPPKSWGPSMQWDLNDHEQIMIITMSFCWHLMLIVIGLLIQLWLVKCVYGSSKRLRNTLDDLLIADDRTATSSRMPRQANKFMSLKSEDEESDANDENVTFDTMRLLNNKNGNSSNTTSGMSSANTSRDKSPV